MPSYIKHTYYIYLLSVVTHSRQLIFICAACMSLLEVFNKLPWPDSEFSDFRKVRGYRATPSPLCAGDWPIREIDVIYTTIV